MKIEYSNPNDIIKSANMFGNAAVFNIIVNYDPEFPIDKDQVISTDHMMWRFPKGDTHDTLTVTAETPMEAELLKNIPFYRLKSDQIHMALINPKLTGG